MTIHFALVTDPRGGSRMLRHSLNAHPAISVSDEIFNPTIRRTKRTTRMPPSKLIAKWQKNSQANASKAAVGTLIPRKPYEFNGTIDIASHAAVWRSIIAAHDCFVSVYRENLLRQYLSELVATSLRNWDCTLPRKKRVKPAVIVIDEFERHIRNMWEWRSRFGSMFRNRFIVSYEELTANWHGVTNRIQLFLGVKPIKLVPKTVKQEVRPLERSIVNFDKVTDFLRKQGLDHWLDENEGEA